MEQAKRSRRWWKWALLAFGIALAATLFSASWTLRHPLTPEQVRAARQLWEAKGPADYTLTYVIRTHDNSAGDRFVVKVRGGQVVEASCNGREEPGERLTYYGMNRLFDYIEDFQKLDEKKKGPTAFYRGTFDPDNGALRWFARRLLGEHQWVEITIEELTIAK